MCAVFSLSSFCHFISMFQSLLTTQTAHAYRKNRSLIRRYADTINIEQSFNDKLLCQSFLRASHRQRARSGSIKTNNKIFGCWIYWPHVYVAFDWLKRCLSLCDLCGWNTYGSYILTCSELLRNLPESDCGFRLNILFYYAFYEEINEPLPPPPLYHHLCWCRGTTYIPYEYWHLI